MANAGEITVKLKLVDQVSVPLRRLSWKFQSWDGQWHPSYMKADKLRQKVAPLIPTHDTPEAVCAAALEFIDVRYQGIFSSASGPGPQELAAAILAAMPGWTLVPTAELGEDRMTMDLMETAIRKDQAEIARLRAALALADSMIRSGERHSPESDRIIRTALREPT